MHPNLTWIYLFYLFICLFDLIWFDFFFLDRSFIGLFFFLNWIPHTWLIVAINTLWKWNVIMYSNVTVSLTLV